MLRSRDAWWKPPALTISAATGDGLAAFWDVAERLSGTRLAGNGALARAAGRRRSAAMHTEIDRALRAPFERHPPCGASSTRSPRGHRRHDDPGSAVARLLALAGGG